MIFDLVAAGKARKEMILTPKDEQVWTNDILLNCLVLASVTSVEMGELIADGSESKGLMDVKLTVNNVEVDLNAGLSKIVKIMNKEKSRKTEVDE